MCHGCAAWPAPAAEPFAEIRTRLDCGHRHGRLWAEWGTWEGYDAPSIPFWRVGAPRGLSKQTVSQSLSRCTPYTQHRNVQDLSSKYRNRCSTCTLLRGSRGRRYERHTCCSYVLPQARGGVVKGARQGRKALLICSVRTGSPGGERGWWWVERKGSGEATEGARGARARRMG